MRPLDESETQQVFEKLHKYIGKNLQQLVERQGPPGPDGSTSGYCLRLHKQRVFYVSEVGLFGDEDGIYGQKTPKSFLMNLTCFRALVRKATNVGRDNLVSLGTCLGKFTKSGKFQLTVTGLDIISQYAKHKIWLKPSSEMSFLYGNHVLKSGLGRITENTEQYQGVVVYSMSDIPLGFGLAAKSTADCRKLDPNAIVVLHQADVGEYLRMEDDL